ncbi:DUF1711 domain protein [Beauveria brongniartii RCEF 3172]|uniref:DUF1711 domain protein n=1 Tax=Beauveria brongniartii RCEF 3172 TaxID=1081107 RepID=A0A166WAJ2_9HYPO|nr:DUF1711 domain protein [Beauveria brongniartii RCEF 3172]
MAPPNKTSDGRRKSGGKPSLVVTLSVPSAILREAIGFDPIKPESPAAASDQKDSSDIKESPSTPVPAANGSGENASDSNAATPAGEGTPAPSVMGPPTDGRKKGVKRGAAGTNEGQLKIRGKPGPKKKPRLEDGTIDHAAVRANAAAHKLGPKANQGAINAGLRALDRSGKPCRKWAKGHFTLKSFTGAVWEINRWTAPPKANGVEGDSEATPADSADSSNKENKENGQENNSTAPSNAGGDVEMQSLPSVQVSSPAPAPTPAPAPVAAAS